MNSATASVHETQKYELQKGNYMLIAYKEKHWVKSKATVKEVCNFSRNWLVQPLTQYLVSDYTTVVSLFKSEFKKKERIRMKYTSNIILLSAGQKWKQMWWFCFCCSLRWTFAHVTAYKIHFSTKLPLTATGLWSNPDTASAVSQKKHKPLPYDCLYYSRLGGFCSKKWVIRNIILFPLASAFLTGTV